MRDAHRPAPQSLPQLVGITSYSQEAWGSFTCAPWLSLAQHWTQGAREVPTDDCVL